MSPACPGGNGACLQLPRRSVNSPQVISPTRTLRCFGQYQYFYEFLIWSQIDRNQDPGFLL